ncbi:MAG: leucine-rich repeat domain-containing protein [Muribaculaceae bacterium]|nr:leucine-rich repeat domain-containing protein [Muribaculaceae bacterium]
MKESTKYINAAGIAIIISAAALFDGQDVLAQKPTLVKDHVNMVSYTIDNIEYHSVRIEFLPFELEVVENKSNISKKDVRLPEELTVECMGDMFSGTKCPVGQTHPAVITRIGERAFKGDIETDKLENISFPSTVKSIGREAFMLSKVSDVELNEGLEYIGDYAFAYCSHLKSIKLPESVRRLGMGCFYNSDIREIDLPSTLESMDGQTFRYCGMLTKIICRATTPPTIDDSDFGYIEHVISGMETQYGPEIGKCIIYVPKESLEAYKNAPGWKNFYVDRTVEGIHFFFDGIRSIEEDLPNDVSAVSAEKNKGINYVIEGDEITVACEAGDRLEIYDTDGICLQRQTATAPANITHKGKGIRIISVNGKSAKVVL